MFVAGIGIFFGFVAGALLLFLVVAIFYGLAHLVAGLGNQPRGDYDWPKSEFGDAAKAAEKELADQR